MSREILPKQLREKIAQLSLDGHSTAEIFDLTVDEAKAHEKSHEQLSKCITTIISRYAEHGLQEATHTKTVTETCQIVPKPKAFNHRKYASVIGQLSATMQEKEFEHSCEGIAEDILMDYEGLENLVKANKAHGFTNPPLDFMGMKDGDFYVIEFKGSLN